MNAAQAKRRLINVYHIKEDELKVHCKTDTELIEMCTKLDAVGALKDDQLEYSEEDDYKLSSSESSLLKETKATKRIEKMDELNENLEEEKQVGEKEKRAVADLLQELEDMDDE